jgi:hypothetical protein
MVEVRLYFRASALTLVYTRVLGGLGSSGCVVYGQVHCPRCVWAPLKYIASGGWPCAIVFAKWSAMALPLEFLCAFVLPRCVVRPAVVWVRSVNRIDESVDAWWRATNVLMDEAEGACAVR